MTNTKTDTIRYRYNRAKETLNEAKVLAAGNYGRGALNRLYFASYYAVRALLTKHDIVDHTHAEVKHHFHTLYVNTNLVDSDFGKVYSDLFAKRQEADYDDFIFLKQETIQAYIPIVERFINDVEDLLD